MKESLNDSGIEFFPFWEARGVGSARESRVYRGVAYDTSYIERLYLQIVVRDVNLEKTIDAILKKTIGLRVSKRIEEEGLDIYEHGESAYN